MPYLIATVLGVFMLSALLLFPWMIIGLLLLVPVAKGAAEYYIPLFLNIDLTLVTCILAGIVALWNLVRRPRSGPPLAIPWKGLWCLLSLALILAAGLAWTSAPEYGFRKALRFAGIGIPFFVLPAFLIRSREEARWVIRSVIVVGGMVALGVILLPATYFEQVSYGRGYARGTVLGSSPIIPATISAAGIVCLLTGFVVRGSAPSWLRYSALIVLPLGLVAILKTGTRSSLIGLLATALLLPLFVGRGGRGKAIFVVLVAIPLAAIAGFLAIQTSAERRMTRWENLTASDRAQELVESRSHHYMFVLEHWWKKPVLGHGSGSFAVDALNRDEPAWPHNIILEAMYETGLVGTLALGGFLWFVVRTGRRGLILATRPEDRFVVLASFITFLLFMMESMAHWDLDGARFLYLFGGIIQAAVAQVAYQPKAWAPLPAAAPAYLAKPLQA